MEKIVNEGVTKELNYHFEQTDEQSWLKNFSGFLGNQTQNSTLTYPPNLANGYIKAGSTEKGLSHRLVNYTLKSDLQFHKKASNEFQITIYFYQVESTSPIEIDINGKLIKSEQKQYDAIYIVGNANHQQLKLKSGTSVKGLIITITEEWINTNVNSSLLSKINLLRNGHYYLKLLTEKERTIINALFTQNEDQLILPRAFANNRLLRLLEKVLVDIASREHNGSLPENINEADFENIMQIEKYLLTIYTENFPSITMLARKACMSETKLKRLFKQAYGMGMYEYYQKNRMHKAKEFLLTTNKNVTQVGNILGYQNLSNFSSAFRKEFNCLPKDIHLAD